MILYRQEEERCLKLKGQSGGDPEAFIRLIEEHRGALLRVAHGFFHREEDVADAVQDTILNAWEQ